MQIDAKSARDDSFFVAPFAADGELMGIGTVCLTQLSPKWLDFCERLITDHGLTFKVSPGGMLSKLEIKFTSSCGAGLGTFFANAQIAVSTVYLQGRDTSAEQEVVRLFIDSVRRNPLVRSSDVARPFEALATIAERRLHVVVAWGNPVVSDEDYELIRELANHFAAAFLCQHG